MPISLLGIFHAVLFAAVIVMVFLAGAINEGRREMLVSYLTPQMVLSMSLQELTEVRVM